MMIGHICRTLSSETRRSAPRCYNVHGVSDQFVRGPRKFIAECVQDVAQDDLRGTIVNRRVEGAYPIPSG